MIFCIFSVAEFVNSGVYETYVKARSRNFEAKCQSCQLCLAQN